jgi:hypothetical protein
MGDVKLSLSLLGDIKSIKLIGSGNTCNIEIKRKASQRKIDVLYLANPNQSLRHFSTTQPSKILKADSSNISQAQGRLEPNGIGSQTKSNKR